ncbi:MAG TPA: glyoxylate/hydroxypyruvate reductase A, partial [Alphaproteobacteria bacterium]|nr:glyoxylate/hydroxypyruvate reductase A [Alphaproteobacteria bacterium]
LPEMRVVTRADAYDPDEIDYVFAWKPTPDAFDALSRLKVLLSFGAGVDSLLRHPRLPAGVPIVRFMDAQLTQQMSDYVVANVGMHQRLMTRFRRDQAARRWVQLYPAPATDSTVGVMGLGVIGSDAIRRLKPLGYPLRGWSRTRKAIEGVETFAGPEEFDAFLDGTDILVNLLPLTPETEGILNYRTFSKLKHGGVDGEGPILINAGRGGHQREADIVRALQDGTLWAASLDVFEVEPLPPESPLWAMDNVFITPHIGGASSIETGVAYFSRVIRDNESGRPLPNVIDVARGY